ncbi:MAG: SH3 domain-containing protein [Desulfofustis sp.]|jgi:SH3-like domain-containing protein
MFATMRRFSILLASVTLLAALSFSSASAAEYVSVSGDNVNVRTGAGTNYEVSMELFEGYPLKVIETQGEWLKIVDFENDSGWIHQSLVTDNNTEIINGNKSVNMRAEPSTNSPIIATVDRGVVMTRLDSQGKWLKLKHATGLVGWIYKPLLWP